MSRLWLRHLAAHQFTRFWPFRLDSSSGQANWATCFALVNSRATPWTATVLNKAISQPTQFASTIVVPQVILSKTVLLICS